MEDGKAHSTKASLDKNEHRRNLISLLDSLDPEDLPKWFLESSFSGSEDSIFIISEKLGIEIQRETDGIKILDYSKIGDYVRDGYLFCLDAGGRFFVLARNAKSLHKFRKFLGNGQIKLIDGNSFFSLAEKNFSDLKSMKSIYSLDFKSKSLTAKNFPSKLFILLSVFILVPASVWLKPSFHLVNNFIYSAQSLLKFFLFLIGIYEEKRYEPSVKISPDLPIYTILVPLYGEPEKVGSLIKSIESINYPKNKLDVKLILEEGDRATLDKISEIDTEDYFHIIITPDSLPKTKPKALNYAMDYCLGEYLVIYDAEDRPDRNQLLKALYAFYSLPGEYACVQAGLNFYNSGENLLTGFFGIEYDIWFNYTIKGLAKLNLPVPLGGSSNHFKIGPLREVGLWDAYNVTEDADIGMRLYAAGYKVKVIDSLTKEEAPISPQAWLGQRSRWIKGYMQSLCSALSSLSLYKKSKLLSALLIFLVVGSAPYGFIVFPLLLIPGFAGEGFLIKALWTVNLIFSFSYAYFTAFYSLSKMRKSFWNFKYGDFLTLALWPAYFLLHILASYKALAELFVKPFFWNKTEHGKSAFDQKK